MSVLPLRDLTYPLLAFLVGLAVRCRKRPA